MAVEICNSNHHLDGGLRLFSTTTNKKKKEQQWRVVGLPHNRKEGSIFFLCLLSGGHHSSRRCFPSFPTTTLAAKGGAAAVVHNGAGGLRQWQPQERERIQDRVWVEEMSRAVRAYTSYRFSRQSKEWWPEVVAAVVRVGASGDGVRVAAPVLLELGFVWNRVFMLGRR